MATFPKYKPYLKQFSRNLRNKSTKSEITLWKTALRAKKMKGYPFRRQRPIGNFIADFACLQLKLVIELDGFTHTEPETIKRDNKKDKYLNSIGFKVLRFTDDEIWNNLNGVVSQIERTISELEEKENLPPTNSPS